MTTEYWVLAVIGGLMVLALAFFAGRSVSPQQRRLEEMRRERDEARAEAERVEGEVARHFEQSARMFGRLADDYRLFFEHFAETAQNLGLSEGRARELLQRADPRLVGDQTAAGAGDAEAATDAEGQPAAEVSDVSAGGRAADDAEPESMTAAKRPAGESPDPGPEGADAPAAEPAREDSGNGPSGDAEDTVSGTDDPGLRDGRRD